jgi:hypothetical protein
MNHEQIAATDARSRYVMRQLSPEEEEAFEAHLIDCAECQEDVQTEMDLREGLRAQSRPGTPVRTGAYRFLAAAAAVLLAVSAALGVRLWHTESDLRAARGNAGNLERRAESAERAAAALAARRGNTEARALTDKGAAATILFLTAVRGSSTGESGPVNRIAIADGIKSVVLSIDLSQPADSATFTASLRTAAGVEVWTGGPLRPYSPNTLAIAIDAAVLRPGDYVVALQRHSPDGRTTVLEPYAFRVIGAAR